MKQKIQHWRDRFEALSVRERAIIAFAVIAGLYTTWNVLVMAPIHTQQKSAMNEISRWQGQIKDVENRIAQITAGITGSGEAGSMLRIKKLQNEISKINQIKKDITVGFIRPEQMADVLKGLLKKQPGLKLIRLQSLDVQPLFPEAPSKDKNGQRNSMSAKQQSTTPATDTTENHSSRPEIYKHGIVLEFQGDYVSTVSYLQSLEALPWKFYWDGMAYEVEEYPNATVTINVFTLSLDSGWIGV